MSCCGWTSSPGVSFRDRVAADGDLVPVAAYSLPETVGAIAPIDGDDGWLVAAGRDVVHLRPEGTHRTIAVVSPPGARMNDVACDPQGRLWAGTVADDARPGGGALHRLDPDGRVAGVLDGLTISNGIGWSPDGETMYLVDSGARTMHAFPFDPHGARSPTAGSS